VHRAAEGRELRGVGAAGLRADLADLEHEAAFGRELEHLPVVVTVAGYPDEASGVDVHVVLSAAPRSSSVSVPGRCKRRMDVGTVHVSCSSEEDTSS